MLFGKRLTRKYSSISSNKEIMKHDYKYLFALAAFLLATISPSSATQYTSVKSGNWNNRTTWGAATAPGNTDTVIITSGFIVKTTTNTNINLVTINSGGTLRLNRNLSVKVEIINNGTITGNRSLILNGTGTVISGTGSYTSHTGTIEFNNTPQTIDAGVVIQKTSGNLLLNNFSHPGITVTNNGQVILLGGNSLTTIISFFAATFTMGTNSVLSVSTEPISSTSATLNASATGNSVNYYGGTYNIKIPSSSTYYDMSVDAGTKTNTAALIMHSLTVASGATFNVGGFNITLSGDWTNNGTISSNTATVTFNGTSAQTITDASGTAPFAALAMSGTGTLNFASNITASTSFIINSGTVDVTSANKSLADKGNFTNSGIFTARNGTVTLNGTTTQSIGGTSTTSFYNLTLAGKTITLNHNESLQDILTVSSGALNGPDSLTMISNSSLTARIAPVTSGASIGANFIMQRYITGSVANYQALSSPSKASILKDWDYDAGFYMSGVSGDNGNAIKNGNIYYSVYKYNEAKNTYDSVNTDNQPLTPGLGLYLWMGNSLSSFSPFTFDTRGIPNYGNVNYSITKNGTGTNLIGNPYDSPLLWTSLQAGNSTKLGTTFYVFDETTGNWESSNGVTGSGGRIASNPNIIAAHQGFMVTAASAGTITFKEAYKGTTDAPIIRAAAPSDMIRIALTTNANTFSDHALIQFNDSATDQYSNNEDALYIRSLLNTVPVLYTLSQDGEKLTSNTLPGSTESKDVTFYAGGGDEGMYTLEFTGINSLSKYNCVQLEDVQNGKWVQINEGSQYSFALTQNGQKYKFILHFKALEPGQDCTLPENVAATEQNTLAGVDILPSQVGADVRFTLPSAQNVTISVYNMLGEKVGQDIQANVMDNTVEVPLPSIQAIYIIRVQSPYSVIDKEIYR